MLYRLSRPQLHTATRYFAGTDRMAAIIIVYRIVKMNLESGHSSPW
jgi:hypothetical protein